MARIEEIKSLFFSNLDYFNDVLSELGELRLELLEISRRMLYLSFLILFPLLIINVLLLVILWGFLKLVVATLPCGDPAYTNVAFFHPYCNAGGGGERVLWCAIRAIQRRYPTVKCYIYTGDTDATPDEILGKARQRFNVVLQRPVQFIFLRSRKLVEAKHYPIFTLLMQSLGSIILGTEALAHLRPDVYIDTMGYAFTYPLFRFIGGCPVISYTHYPTISTDMLKVVSDRTEAHNNRAVIAKSFILSSLKLGYYYFFALLYFLAGKSATIVMVNSTWTFNHIDSLWRRGNETKVVYPPCDTEKFKSLTPIPLSKQKERTIVSIGQFRPEKDHELQLRSFHKLLNLLNDDNANIKLILIGGCRNVEDQLRVDDLKKLASDLNIQEKVVWKLNAPFEELLETVQQGTIGLHTMWNEHFGICIVECMAGGLIMVAHDSGGPKLDIVKDYDSETVGYLASDEESYAQSMKTVLELSDDEFSTIQTYARSSVSRFSDEEFNRCLLETCQPVFSHLNDN